MEPMLPLEKLDADLLVELFARELSPSEWTEEFSLIGGGGSEGALDVQEVRELKRDVTRFKEACTPSLNKRKRLSMDAALMGEWEDWGKDAKVIEDDVLQDMKEGKVEAPNVVELVLRLESDIRYLKQVLPNQMKLGFGRVSEMIGTVEG